MDDRPRQDKYPNLKRGNTANVGQKRTELRLACIEGFNMAVPLLTQMLLDHFSGKRKLSTKELCNITDVLGKYGAGSVQSTELTGSDGEQLTIKYTFGSALPAVETHSLPQPAIQANVEPNKGNLEEPVSVNEDVVDAEFSPEESGEGFYPEFRRKLY